VAVAIYQKRMSVNVMRPVNKEPARRLKLATLGEWALVTYGALLLIQIVLAFILLVLFTLTPPAGFGD
jgi:hypothetical protein